MNVVPFLSKRYVNEVFLREHNLPITYHPSKFENGLTPDDVESRPTGSSGARDGDQFCLFKVTSFSYGLFSNRLYLSEGSRL